MANDTRTTRTMTMSEAGMYQTYISKSDPINGLFPCSITTPYKGSQFIVSGYSHEDMKKEHRAFEDHKWIVVDDIDNGAPNAYHTREWVAKMQTKGYDAKESVIWYTKVTTTVELLAKWDKACSYDGLPHLYWG